MSDTDVQHQLDPRVFKEAMSRFPSGVTVIMTHDDSGVAVGMTVTTIQEKTSSERSVLTY